MYITTNILDIMGSSSLCSKVSHFCSDYDQALKVVMNRDDLIKPADLSGNIADLNVVIQKVCF